MRLTDADKITDVLWRMASYQNKTVYYTLRAAIEAIKSCPTIDPEDLISRAKWLDMQNGYGVCSNCNRGDHIDPLAKFCRYCGARLGEGGHTMNKKTRELLRLISENPDLPIVPMVDGEIPGDYSGYWLGVWDVARVDEYLLTRDREWVVFKSDDDVFNVLEWYLSSEEFEKLPESEEECRPFYNALPWNKAIIVYINSGFPHCGVK